MVTAWLCLGQQRVCLEAGGIGSIGRRGSLPMQTKYIFLLLLFYSVHRKDPSLRLSTEYSVSQVD